MSFQPDLTMPPADWQPVVIMCVLIDKHEITISEQVSPEDLSSTFILAQDGVFLGRYALLPIAIDLTGKRALGLLTNQDPL